MTSERSRLKIWGIRKSGAIHLFIPSLIWISQFLTATLFTVVSANYSHYLISGSNDSTNYRLSIEILSFLLILMICTVILRLIVVELFGYYDVEGSALRRKIVFKNRTYSWFGNHDLTKAKTVLVDQTGTLIVVVRKEPSDSYPPRHGFAAFWNQSTEQSQLILSLVQSMTNSSIPIQKVKKLRYPYQKYYNIKTVSRDSEQ